MELATLIVILVVIVLAFVIASGQEAGAAWTVDSNVLSKGWNIFVTKAIAAKSVVMDGLSRIFPSSEGAEAEAPVVVAPTGAIITGESKGEAVAIADAAPSVPLATANTSFSTEQNDPLAYSPSSTRKQVVASLFGQDTIGGDLMNTIQDQEQRADYNREQAKLRMQETQVLTPPKTDNLFLTATNFSEYSNKMGDSPLTKKSIDSQNYGPSLSDHGTFDQAIMAMGN